MTETEWLACEDPVALLSWLSGRGSLRKLHLFGSAVGRLQAREQLQQPQSVRFSLYFDTWERAAESGNVEEWIEEEGCPWKTLWDTPAELFLRALGWGWGRHHLPEMAFLVHDVFGNPFRVPALDGIWLTPTVITLAQAAYDTRLLPIGHLERARLAVLADAFEEAGCTNLE